MKRITKASDVINSTYIKPGSLVYAAGNVAVPQELIRQLARDPYIYNIERNLFLDTRGVLRFQRNQTGAERELDGAGRGVNWLIWLIGLIADCRLPTADCRLLTADCRLPTAD
jgi:hypothetical protein